MKKRSALWMVLGIIMFVITTISICTSYIRVYSILLESCFIAIGVHMVAMHQTHRTQLIMPIAFCVLTALYTWSLISNISWLFDYDDTSWIIHTLTYDIIPVMLFLLTYAACAVNAFTKNALKPLAIVFLAILISYEYIMDISSFCKVVISGYYGFSGILTDFLIGQFFNLRYVILLVLVAATPRRRRAA